MKCTKCGCDTLKKDGDWYTCLQCGNVMFDTSVSAGDDRESPTKAVERMEANGSKAAEPVQDTETAPAKASKKGKKDKPQKQEKKKSPLRDIIDFMFPIVLAVVIAIVLKTFVFANAIIPTGSMINTIQEKDRVIASRLSYKFHDPERYDIVIFNYPDDESQYYVKRVIGLPGETVEVVKGVVYVTKTDGETIQLEDSFVTNCVPTGDYGPYEVPADSYFMMGDNRNDSLDSRFWKNKYVARDKIIGKVQFRYYPSPSKIE